MRFSTQMMYQQNMRGITNSQAEWMKYGEQMSTGKRVVNPSDDPIAASQAVVLSQAQAQNSQYTLARTFATQKVSLEESVLSQVTTAIQNAQEKIVYASNGTLSDVLSPLKKCHWKRVYLARSPLLSRMLRKKLSTPAMAP